MNQSNQFGKMLLDCFVLCALCRNVLAKSCQCPCPCPCCKDVDSVGCEAVFSPCNANSHDDSCPRTPYFPPVSGSSRLATRGSSTRRPSVLNPSRSGCFHPLPLNIRTLTGHIYTPIRTLITDILQRRPLPLHTSSSTRECRWLIRTTIRTRTHGVVGGTGHADSPVHILLGVDEVRWASCSRTRGA
jgi:hypothetical protein